MFGHAGNFAGRRIRPCLRPASPRRIARPIVCAARTLEVTESRVVEALHAARAEGPARVDPGCLRGTRLQPGAGRAPAPSNLFQPIPDLNRETGGHERRWLPAEAAARVRARQRPPWPRHAGRCAGP
jgi:hypothetical protein